MPLFPNMRTWYMINQDTGQQLKGQFEATGVVENISNKYVEHNRLNAQNAILQYLHGNSDTLSFQARLYADTVFDSVNDELNTLKVWMQRLEFRRRPPIIVFWIGDASIYIESVIDSLAGITYDRPTFSGAIRGVTLTVNLRQYVPFELEGGLPPETRYHRSRRKDYYESLAWREYGNALLGDVVRKRHPALPNIRTGDTIKLPSLAAIRKIRVTQTSIALQGAYEKKASPQKTLRLDMFDKRNRTFVSHVVLDD